MSELRKETRAAGEARCAGDETRTMRRAAVPAAAGRVHRQEASTCARCAPPADEAANCEALSWGGCGHAPRGVAGKARRAAACRSAAHRGPRVRATRCAAFCLCACASVPPAPRHRPAPARSGRSAGAGWLLCAVLLRKRLFLRCFCAVLTTNPTPRSRHAQAVPPAPRRVQVRRRGPAPPHVAQPEPSYELPGCAPPAA